MSRRLDWNKEEGRQRVLRQGNELSASTAKDSSLRKGKRTDLDNRVSPIVVPTVKSRRRALNKRMAMLVAIKKEGNLSGDLDLVALNKEIDRLRTELGIPSKKKRRRRK